MCVDVVRMGECARSAGACRLPRRPSIFSAALIVCVTERGERAWPASNEAADAENMESLVGQKELIKV